MEYIKKSYIECIYCHQKAPLKTKPIYDESFKKTGEKFSCGFCKKEYEESEIPFVKKQKLEVGDRTALETCSNCEYFVKNIFCQKCMLTKKTVNVYDSCDFFTVKKETRDLPF
ncbi:MAG: hypothetical protein KAI43_07010 [Candidatus Aureabacteria bacterium]|nr:hypothetical protein [Candidatus Auribacterota bacterium]